MSTQNNIEERLWDFIDGVSSAEEKTVIEQLIAHDAAWKAKYRELLEVHELVQSTDLETPSLRFTRNVMEEISKLHITPAAKTYINKRIIWGIGIFFITLIIAFIVYGVAQADWTTGNSNSNINISEKLDKVDIGKFFNNTWVNAFMIINVVLGLFLLDNYLSYRKKLHRNKTNITHQ